MRYLKIIPVFLLLLLVSECGKKEKKISIPLKRFTRQELPAVIPIDKGFSQFITGYTSGMISSNSAIEIRFTPEFAASADKSALGLFSFDPNIKGKTEWKNETTLVLTPARPLDPGTIYTGSLNLGKLAEVNERFRSFPVRIQTIKKDFRVIPGFMECDPDKENSYLVHGEVAASDYIEPAETESYLEAKLGRKNLGIVWDHSDNLNHKFTIKGIDREDKEQVLSVIWDGSKGGVKQKGSTSINIPPSDYFSVIDVIKSPGKNPRIDVVFSDPVDGSQELEGLIHFSPYKEIKISAKSNIITLYPTDDLTGEMTLNIESSIRNIKGTPLPVTIQKQLDFTQVPPGIMLEGKGVILPASQNLIFPFKAANLKAVDLRIVRIFENNLPHFLQENDIDQGYSVKRFGRPVYSGRFDLLSGSETNTGTWNLYTINLADYIDVEPGVMYKVSLSMRKSYSLYPCKGSPEESNYEELLQQSEEQFKESWDDPDNYYEEAGDEIYYSYGFKWEDRDDPCKEAYFSPDKRITRNILASNFGIIAKKGADNILHVFVNDLLSALPVNEAAIEVFDYQLQLIASGSTNPDGSAALACERKPFLIIAKKDKDRNYLKINDGSSLSLSSFDVTGTAPENGIKAFVYGERDVWRPGDSIFLSILIKDMKNDLPAGHPVQFELINPQGQKVDNQVQKADEKNLLVFSTRTSPEAITGNYKANFRIGGATFSKRVRVETIKPNRLKINLNFDDEILGGSKSVSRGTLNAKWLNGAVARNLKSSVDYILKKTKTEFDKYKQYNFDDPVSEFYSETVNIFNNEIDGNGNAGLLFKPGSDLVAPGMLNAVFTAKVSEKGGDESIIQTTYKYAPYSVFAGINLPGLQGKSRMLFTDADNVVKIVTVDETGKPVRSEVEINIYKISYRWWWESDEENLGNYISNEIYKPVIKESIVTQNGEGSFTFRIGKNDWGRYLIRATTPEGHSTGKILLIDWPWEYGMKENSEGATLLAISTDKEKYNPGDEIKISFPSPENSRAIITLENSTGVTEEIRTNTDKGNTVVKFPAKPEMAPNIYAYVTVIQPHDQTINDMPVRLYGVVPVMVEDPSTRLQPKIEINEELRSQKPFTVKVSETNKKPMNYTLAVVDEGLLDITGFKTPDPWNYFFSREALGVITWDLYDFVLGSYGGTLDRIFAIGGDEALIDRAANKAQRFVPVVKFFGPYHLDAGKTNNHPIELPQYTGSVKTMVIAGSDNAFGFAEKSSFVRDPLMILATAPRTISPGDKVVLPVTLFIQKEGIREVTVNAEANDLINFREKTKTVSVSGTEEDTELFFTVGDKTGITRINVTATGGGETASFTMEIDVRSPNPPEVRSELRVIQPGSKWETTFKPFGMEGTGSANLTISSLPAIDIGKKMDYLLDYPHGCSEQIISAAFPQLWIKELTGGDAQISKKASANVTEAIEEISSRQMVNGGIALWPGVNQPDNWVTSYAGHFMTEAERLGYSIPSGFKQKWMTYQKARSQEWRLDPKFRQTTNDQAYRLFTLALAGQPEKSAMNRLRETTDIPQTSRWLLAAGFATTGRREVADDLLDMRNIKTEPEYQDYYYGSEIRDKAIILYTLSLLNKNDEALPLLKEICDNFSNDNWYSTQSVAWGLFSYMKWADKISGDKNTPVKIKVAVNGETADQTIQPGKIWSKDLKLKQGDNSIVIENPSSNPVYASVTMRGIPLNSEQGNTEKGLSMKIDYLNSDLSPVDHKNLAQGSDFMMVVKVTNNTFTRVENIALTSMVPSGWEIQNTRLFEAVTGIKESAFEYRDYRDDRVNTYFSLLRGETKTFIMILNAAYKGEFNQPGIWCEAMYNAGYYSRHPGNTVKVTGENIE
jgi:alpha-2-macroglobulin